MVRDGARGAHGSARTQSRSSRSAPRATASRIARSREAGGKGLFTKEIEEALLAGAIDLAVHSAKDMPTVLPDGLMLAACLPREDVRDAFISRKAASLRDLPHGAVVGTASLRRQAMVKRLRPDISVVPLRGNVETRLRKLEAGEVDATLLALAGLKRLGLADKATALLDVDEFLPAVGQGAITIEAREDDARTRELLAKIDHADTSVALACERAFLAVLDGSCRTPIAGHAVLDGDAISLSRHDPAARRQRGVRDEPRRQPARRGGARRRCGRGVEAPRAGRFLRGVTCACWSRGRNPTRRAPRRLCARAATRCWSRRFSSRKRSRRKSEDRIAAVLMTSANAARAVARIRATASCIGFRCSPSGDRTAEAARASGFSNCGIGGRCAA